MSCTQCQGIRQQFGDGMARRELRQYRRKGARGTTRMLLDAVREVGIQGRSFLDVGGGVGVIQHELMASGAAVGTSADASPAYLAAARAEALERGYADRMTYREGDFVELAPDLPQADIVTLDRVLCCYPDMPTLVDASMSRARHVWATVIPREERGLVRWGVTFVNLMQRLRRAPFRVFGHARSSVEERLTAAGWSPRFHGTTFLWRVLVFTHD